MFDRFSCQVAQALALTGPEPTRQELLALIGPDARPGEVDRALDDLRARGLIERTGGVIRIHPALREQRAPAGLGPTATELLALRTTEQLCSIASNIGMTRPLGLLTTRQLVAGVADRLTAPDRVRDVIHRAPTDVVALAMRLADGKPAITTSAGFEAVYSPTAPESKWRSPHRWLVRWGLLVEQEWYQAVMPREVAMVLRGGRPFKTVTSVRPPLFPMAVDAAHVERSAASMAARAVGSVEQLIGQWGSRPPRLLKNGAVGLRELRRFSSSTGLATADACFVVELAGHADLVGVDRAGWVARPGAVSDAWLDLTTERRWEVLVRAWLGSPSYPGASEQRRLCLAALLDADPGTGIDEDSLCVRLEWDDPLLWSRGPATPARKVASMCRDAERLGMLHEGSLSERGREVARGDLETAAVAPRRGLGD